MKTIKNQTRAELNGIGMINKGGHSQHSQPRYSPTVSKHQRSCAVLLAAAALATGFDDYPVRALDQNFCTGEIFPEASNSHVFKAHAEASWTTGAKTVLFMRVSYSDQRQDSISAARATELMEQVNAFFEADSFGLTSLQATITPALQLEGTVAWYTSNPASLLVDAREAAAAVGLDTSNFDLDCVYCGPYFAINLGYVGGKGAWLSSTDVGVVCHEFGHNLGLRHANAWITDDGASIGDGRNQEYGNFYDTMGYGMVSEYAFNAYEKHLLGWLPDEAVVSTSTSGVFRLSSVDAPELSEGSHYALNIPKDGQRDYWVEMRQQKGDPQLENGVLVFWSPWYESNGGTQLIDCNPWTKGKQALQVGQVFYDLDIGLKIAPLQRHHGASETIDVSVEQVYFQALELALSRNAPSDIHLARRSAPATIKPAAPIKMTVPTGSCEITIPEAGTYFIWVQGAAPASQTFPTQVQIMDEMGQTGVARSYPSPDNSLWSLVGTSIKGYPSEFEAQRFTFSEGSHTLQVRAGTGTARSVRVLVTNDPATNLPPVISMISDQVVEAGSKIRIPFFISAVGTSVSDLEARVFCQDSALIPDSNVTLTVQGSDAVLEIQAPAQMGTSEVSIMLTDRAGRLASQSFTLSVIKP